MGATTWHTATNPSSSCSPRSHADGARDQLRFAVGATQNRNLFPVHFLEQRLPEWPEYADLDCAYVLTQLKEIWDRERDLLPSFNEDQTEDRLVRPILGILGFSYTPRPALDVAGRRREPDYALFLDSAGRAEAEAVGGSARYLRAVAVLEAKRFDRPLDRRRASGSLSEDPVAQVIHYVGTTKGTARVHSLLLGECISHPEARPRAGNLV